MQGIRLCWLPYFLLGLAVAPHFFNARIATAAVTPFFVSLVGRVTLACYSSSLRSSRTSSAWELYELAQVLNSNLISE